MSETPFYRTRMGRTYYEHTMPELVAQLRRLNELLESLTTRLDHQHKDDGNATP